MTNTTDTGFGNFDAYEVKKSNGKKGKDWRGDDTGQMANELFEKNPGRFASPADAQRAIINANNSFAKLPANQRPAGWRLITDKDGGIDCSGKKVNHDWRIYPGQIVYYPEVPNDITEPRKYSKHCPDTPAIPVEVAAVPPVVVAPPKPVPAPAPAPAASAGAGGAGGAGGGAAVRPMAQLLVNPQGTARDAMQLDAAMYYLGKPPKDVAAEWKGEKDRLRDGLKSGKQEGTLVNTADKKGALEGLGYVSDKDQLKLSRARDGGELEFAPGQHIRLGAKGQIVGPNPNLNQKMETGVRLAKDSDGVVRTVVDMQALISENRRENPEYKGYIREAFTARNKIDALSNTGEGLTVVTTYLGIEKAYEKTAAAFAKAPTAKDAETLLQLNVQAALHPLVWSVDSYGVPSKGPQVLKTEMGRVINKLPPGAERERLMETYGKPYAELLDEPAKLNAAITKNGGRANWVNPMVEWANERQKLDFIREGYGDVPITEAQKKEKLAGYYGQRGAALGRKEINELQDEESKRVGQLYAKQMWEEAIRPPTKTEVKLGMGMLHDAQGQTEGALRAGRQQVLETLSKNPEVRAAWIDHMLATPGGLQNVTDLLHFSSNENSGNHQILGFKDAAEGRSGALKLATQLAGKEQGEALMRQETGFFEGIGNGLVRFATIGFVSPGKNENQNNGLFGLQEETAKRWNDSATKAEVDAAVKAVVDRALAAEQTGKTVGSIASTAIVLSMETDRAENAKTTKTHDALFKKLEPAAQKTVDNQMVANLDHAGERYVSAAVAKATQRGALAGNVATVGDAANAAAIASGAAAGLTGVTAAPTGNGKVAATVLSTDAAAQARAAALAASKPITAAQAASITSTAAGSMVSQNQLNAHTAKVLAAAAPAEMAGLLVGAKLAAAQAGNKAATAAIDAQLANLAEQGSAGKDLAAMISAQADAVKAAGGTPAAYASAQQAFAGFFAGKDAGLFSSTANAVTSRGVAVGVLAGDIATDPVTAAALDAALHASSSKAGASVAGTTAAGVAGGKPLPVAGTPAAGASPVAGTPAGAGQVAGTPAGTSAPVAGTPAGGVPAGTNPLAGLSTDAQTKLAAIGAITTPEAQGAALQTWMGTFASELNGVTAGAGVSVVEVLKWLLLTQIPGKDKPKDPPLNPGEEPGCGLPGDFPTGGSCAPGGLGGLIKGARSI